jgi:hypothetical protein
LNFHQLWPALENTHIEKISATFFGTFSVGYYSTFVYPCFDHITEMNFGINYHIVNYTCLTNNSMILCIVINDSSVTDLPINDDSYSHLVRLIERNLNLQLNRLHKVTEAIVNST